MKKNIFILLCLFLINNIYSETNLLQASSVDLGNAQIAMASADYKVTAGDIYSLNYSAGTTSISYSILLDSTYKIRVSNLAIIDAKDKTFIQLKKQVEEIVTKNYPMSGVQFALISPSVFNIIIKGEVTQTSEKSVWALTRLSDLVHGYATSYASNRNVKVTSAEGVTKSYDLFKSQRFGDLSNDPFLRPGDTIEFQRAKRIVSIEGAVERPGHYELLENENLKDLIYYYGNGLAPMADTSSIELKRINNQNYLSGEKIYLQYQNIEENFPLMSYDNVFINSYSKMQPIMFFEGAVVANGDSSNNSTYLDGSNRIAVNFNFGENYSYLIRRCNSYFTSTSDKDKAYIIRESKIIPININKILYDTTFNFEENVEENDTLVIPFKQYFISVAGSVNFPGRYPYIPDRTWDYYIGLAGGFIKSQNASQSISIIDINGNELQKSDVITPECIITAKTNSFTYYFNQYVPIITTMLSIISTSLSILAITGVFTP
ncbi:MAG: ligand-binding protein [Treponema sp.]|nr:ligand-binding protein [Treponema sp.]